MLPVHLMYIYTKHKNSNENSESLRPNCDEQLTVNESLVILGEVRSWPWAFVSRQGVISYNVGVHLARLELVRAAGSLLWVS